MVGVVLRGSHRWVIARGHVSEVTRSLYTHIDTVKFFLTQNFPQFMQEEIEEKEENKKKEKKENKKSFFNNKKIKMYLFFNYS